MVYLNLQNVDFLLKGFCILHSVDGLWLKGIIAAVTGTCIFGDAATFINKDCRVLFGCFIYCAFLGFCLRIFDTNGWENLVTFDWNDLPVGREFDGKFLKNVKSPPHALPTPPSPPPALH